MIALLQAGSVKRPKPLLWSILGLYIFNFFFLSDNLINLNESLYFGMYLYVLECMAM